MRTVYHLWFIATGVVAATPAAAQNLAPTIDHVLDAWQRTEDQFFGCDSFAVLYERTRADVLEPSSVFSGSLLAKWRWGHKGDIWLLERQFTHPFSNEDITVPAKPKLTTARDQLVFELERDTRIATLTEFDLGRNMYSGLYFTENVFLDAPKYIARSYGLGDRVDQVREEYPDEAGLPFLPQFVRDNRANYTVHPDPQIVDGVPCWVVEWPGMDRIWVDTARGCAVPRRRYCWGPGKPMRIEVLNTDYREVNPGLWLPMRQVVNQYASIVGDPAPLWGTAVTRLQYEVSSIEFDGVSDDFFAVDLEPGTRVYDMVREIQYTVRGSEQGDPFDTAIERAREYVQVPSRWSQILKLVIAAAAGCIMLWAIWIRTRRTKVRA
jgi:hypothetical protein